MRRILVVLLAGLLAGCSSSSSPGPTPTTQPDTQNVVIPELADHGGKAIVAYLSPPGPGNQSGSLRVSSNGGQAELCYALRYENISRPTSFRMYKGQRDSTDGEVVTFAASAPTYACKASFSREFLRDIAKYPADYGVDVSVGGTIVLTGRFEPLKQPYQ